MKGTLALLTAITLAASPTGTSSTSTWHTQPPIGDTRGASAQALIGPEPPTTLVTIGDRAPDFSFTVQGNHWLHLHDLLTHGPVLLVFATEDAQLSALQGERARLLDLGVVPVVVLDRRSGAVAAAVRRLGVEMLVIPDVQHAIASQFNVIDPDTRQAGDAWFVIDRRAMVRALNRSGVPARGFTQLAAAALSIPSPDVAVPTTHGR